MMRIRTCFLFASVTLGACSGPAVVVQPTREPPPIVVDEPVEAFDIAGYADEPATVETEMVHDVPDRLMKNQVASGTVREMAGFRVQVFSTLDLTEATSMEEEVKAYWQSIHATDPEAVDGIADPAVYRFFRQPYYRIRVGDFSSRSRADRLARLMAARFPGAFVVPDRVTVRN